MVSWVIPLHEMPDKHGRPEAFADTGDRLSAGTAWLRLMFPSVPGFGSRIWMICVCVFGWLTETHQLR
jgi:hypothetical protein